MGSATASAKSACETPLRKGSASFVAELADQGHRAMRVTGYFGAHAAEQQFAET
jgi:hypothetical protein